MQSIHYNYEECITNLDFTISFDLLMGPNLKGMIESGL